MAAFARRGNNPELFKNIETKGGGEKHINYKTLIHMYLHIHVNLDLYFDKIRSSPNQLKMISSSTSI